MLTVTNTQGTDITEAITSAARQYDIDPVHLLALLKAESGLDSRAERWGRRTIEAKAALRTLGLL